MKTTPIITPTSFSARREAAVRRVSLAERPVATPAPAVHRPTPCLARVLDVVCGRLGVTVEDLRSPRRHPMLVLARELACVLARRLTTCSFAEIALAVRPLGARGVAAHSTAITAINRFERTSGQQAWGIGKTKAELLDDMMGEAVQGQGVRTFAKFVRTLVAVIANRSECVLAHDHALVVGLTAAIREWRDEEDRLERGREAAR